MNPIAPVTRIVFVNCFIVLSPFRRVYTYSGMVNVMVNHSKAAPASHTHQYDMIGSAPDVLYCPQVAQAVGPTHHGRRPVIHPRLCRPVTEHPTHEASREVSGTLAL